MKLRSVILKIWLCPILLLLATVCAKGQTQADFILSLDPSPSLYPGYPSSGKLDVIVTLPTEPATIPANTFAVIVTAGGAVVFDLSSFTPPAGWALHTEHSDNTNAYIFNNAPLIADLPIPVVFELPTRAAQAGETRHGADIEAIDPDWEDPDHTNNQPRATVTVPDVSLPVVLSSFNVSKENTSSHLSWATTEESNSSHFAIEHSTDAKSWREIGRVKSTETSNSLQRYSYTHDTPSGGINYYRLRMTDLDGSFELSIIKSLEFPLRKNIEVFPNPVRDRFSIRSDNWEQVTAVALYNSIGIAAYRSDKPQKEVNVGHLPAGIYMLRITRTDNFNETHRIIIHP